MAKMHELLAVESSVVANFNRDTKETEKVLERGDLFQRMVTRKTHFNEEDQKLDTIETKEITTTVSDRLRWYSNAVVSLLDLIVQKDSTNQKAVADLVVGDNTLATSVPATTLLTLETRLNGLRDVFEKIPTLPVGAVWNWDPNDALYKIGEPTVSFSTRKDVKAVVLYPATDKHPAQVEKISTDTPIAKVTRDVHVGMMSSTDKAELLSRLDILLKAVKTARQRANSTEVVKASVGAVLMNYLFDGVLK